MSIQPKEIGLFPQTSKINIRKVADIETEIKSVSRPPEPSIGPFGNQTVLRKRLLAITQAKKVPSDLATRFKYLLARATPYHTLNSRLLNVLREQPEFSETITGYFSRYPRIPKKAADEIIRFLNSSELYHSTHADLLRACLDNLPPAQNSLVADFCYNRLLNSSRFRRRWPLPPQPTYKEALQAWVIRNQKISFAQLSILKNSEVDWWIRKSIFRELETSYFGVPSFTAFVNECIRHDEREIARSAANAMIEDGVTLRRPYGDANSSAKLALRTVGLVKSVGRPASVVGIVFSYLLKRPVTIYNWRRLLGPKHKQAEKIAVLVKQKLEVDIDACVPRLDSLCDLIFEVLVSRVTPGAGYGYGSILKSPNPILTAALPNTIQGFKAIHAMRLLSLTAHPRSQRTGAPTKRLKHSDFRKLILPLSDALTEIEALIVP